MDEIENIILNIEQIKPSFRLRYIDDIFFEWTHGEEELDMSNLTKKQIFKMSLFGKKEIPFILTSTVKELIDINIFIINPAILKMWKNLVSIVKILVSMVSYNRLLEKHLDGLSSGTQIILTLGSVKRVTLQKLLIDS